MWFRTILTGTLLSIASGAATLQDLDFISGHWRGEAGGQQIEEIWSAPEQGSITGMYREMKDGLTTFYEFLTIEASPDGPVLLMYHFDPGLKSWEEKSKPAAFHVRDLMPSQVVFEGGDKTSPLLLTWSRTSRTTLEVLIERQRNGEWVKQLSKYTLEEPSGGLRIPGIKRRKSAEK
jgi:hypothetical protein